MLKQIKRSTVNGMPHAAAQAELIAQLFDALWLENIYDFQTHCAPGTELHSLELYAGEQLLATRLAPGKQLLWPVVSGSGLRPYRFLQPRVWLAVHARVRPLSITELGTELVNAHWWPAEANNRLFQQSLSQALDYDINLQQAAAQFPDVLTGAGSPGLNTWEMLSALRDRPFYPLAKAKLFDTRTRPPLPGARFKLQWLAVPRRQLLHSPYLPWQPFADLLPDKEQRQLLQRAHSKQLGGDDYLWLAVHPLQHQWLLQHRHSENWFTQCVDLEFSVGQVTATASLRSVACDFNTGHHLKLSLSLCALGAVRTLPPRYLHNGRLAQDLLLQIIAGDDWLHKHVQLCDESSWVAVARTRPPQLLPEHGELACLIRVYPKALQEDASVTLIPMSALAVVDHDRASALLWLAQQRNHHGDAATLVSQLLTVFDEVAAAVIQLGLRCFNAGVMPEIHGQNIVLVYRCGRLSGLVLRDHDTLRICPPLLKEAGLARPEYAMDTSTPGTLVLDKAEHLLAYFQTLGLEVNLYAIIDALQIQTGIEENNLWKRVRRSLEHALSDTPLSDICRRILQQHLLDAPHWPFKQLITPLLASGQLHTGMPSRMGWCPNPLLA